MRWERYAPWYASGFMVLLSFTNRATMLTPKRMVTTLVTVGGLLIRTAGICLPIGLIMCGLTVTGVAGSFAAGLVSIGGENIFLTLVLGVTACYVMGMAGLVTPAYIFLALTLAPAAIKIASLNVLAVHLFIIYYAMLANITPPVATAAFLGSTMAGAPAMKTAFQAMRLGIVIYFIPFFFVFNPALVLQGSPIDTIYLFALCIVGIVLIAAGLEGYLLKFGKLGLWERPLLIISGLLIGFPQWTTTIVGAILALFVLAIMLLIKGRGIADNKAEVSP